MHPADIQAAIKKAGASQSSIGRELPGKTVSRMAVSHVISGRSKSARIALRISEVTGVPVRELWPGKYPILEMQQRPGALPMDPKALMAGMASLINSMPRARAKARAV